MFRTCKSGLIISLIIVPITAAESAEEVACAGKPEFL